MKVAQSSAEHDRTPRAGRMVTADEKTLRAGALRLVDDITNLMGIPEAEVTPSVRSAIGSLMDEVERTLDELDALRRRVRDLERLADEDGLLPVVNRRAFVRELSRSMAFARRYGAVGSIAYFDVNGMKSVNDRFGHAAGDAVLHHVADVLTRSVRGSDIVARLGGDEFGVILSRADAPTGQAKAEALARCVEATTCRWQGVDLPVSVAFGAYAFHGADDAVAAIDAADRAMYAHKRARS